MLRPALKPPHRCDVAAVETNLDSNSDRGCAWIQKALRVRSREAAYPVATTRSARASRFPAVLGFASGHRQPSGQRRC